MRRDLALALALVGALFTAYVFGRCAQQRGVELRAWKDSTAAAHRESAELVDAYRREQLATAAVARSLDSALAGWQEALVKSDPRWIQGPASLGAPPPPDPLRAPGVNLARSCSAYQSACELALERADSAITALQGENDLLRRRPGDTAARHLQPWIGGGVDPLARVPELRGGVDWRLWGDWHLGAEVDYRIAPGDSARLWVGVRRTF